MMDLPSLTKFCATLCVGFLCLATPSPAQSAAAGEAEAQKCHERAAAVRRDVFGKYESALGELQSTLQKSADLEGALAVRAERTRIAAEQTLIEKDYVAEPKSLRALQVQTISRLQDLLTQLVAETVPKLVELKRQLTVTGKLDDAVAVRTAIETLQNSYLPAARVANGAAMAADALVTAYSADRNRADKIYKGQKLIVRGVVAGFRIDPEDSKIYHIFLTGGASGGWVQCAFSGGDHKFREEKSAYAPPALLITTKDGEGVRVQKGAGLDVRGICEGWDETVRLSRCEVAR